MSKIKRQILISKAKRHGKSITENVLGILFSLAEVADSLILSKEDTYNALNANFGGYDWSRAKSSKYLGSFEKTGYIKSSLNKEGQKSIELTNKARLRMIDRISGSLKPDKKTRFVSFDIPEEKRTARNAFRRAIKRIGFKQIQKSLWVSNKNVGDLIESASYEYGVEKYIVYIIAEKTDVDGLISKMFAEKE